MAADDGTFVTTETRRSPHTYERTHQRPGAIRLRVLRGPGADGRVSRWRKQRVTAGRSLAADLRLADTSLSGLHFELQLRGEHVWLRDLGSTNGTWLGDYRVGEVGLPPGATFTAGACEIQLVGTETVDVPISAADHFGEMYGDSDAMREVFARLERLALAGVDVVLHGDTGTGKELAARAIHQHSTRKDGPFVVLDCAALSSTLATSALFGHAKGAFTDAQDERPGCFEEAAGGTLFIDELGELPLELQPNLLRVLDRREVVRVGETKPRRVDVRVVAATHRDLQRMVAEGEFRQDLFFRLSQSVVQLPALEERGDDVVRLAERFGTEFGGPGWRVSPEAEAKLRGYEWPGNVRELRQVIRAAVALGVDGGLDLGRLTREGSMPAPTIGELRALPWKEAFAAFERFYLASLMRECDGNLSEAERRSGIFRKTLRKRLQQYGLRE